jgi:hypothetical protein
MSNIGSSSTHVNLKSAISPGQSGSEIGEMQLLLLNLMHISKAAFAFLIEVKDCLLKTATCESYIRKLQNCQQVGEQKKHNI